MKIIIPLAGFGKRMRPHTWSRPKPLLNVAGNTIIGHLLHLMRAITTAEVYFIVGYKREEIAAWIRAHFPHLNAHFIVQEEARGQAHAIWMCREFMDAGEWLVAFGDGVVAADYANIPEPGLDGVCLVQEVDDPRKFGVVATDDEGLIRRFIEKPETDEHKKVIAGIYWFRNGLFLRDALDTVIREERQTKGEYYLADAYQVMLAQGAKIGTKPTTFWYDAGNPENVLETNARLLGLGYGVSPNAIDRSYAEDFTVLPPVFIDETAVISGSVIGPYASIHARAVITDSIIRNSIIDEGAEIKEMILDGALVGQKTRVQGRSQQLFIGDNSQIDH